jgi:hypothetical protein
VFWAVFGTVSGIVSRDMYWAADMEVHRAVGRAVDQAVWRAVIDDPAHPALDDLLSAGAEAL